MLRLIAVTGLAFVVVTSAQAMTPASLAHQDDMITQVRMGCGAGRVMVVFASPEQACGKSAAPIAGVHDIRAAFAILSSTDGSSDSPVSYLGGGTSTIF